MKTILGTGLIGAIALTGAASATAQEREINYPKGSLGVQAIMSSDFAKAERQLDDFRVHERDPGRLINMGYVLAKTGRTEAAARTFALVLEEEDVELIVADGRSLRSHDIARIGLRSLAGE